MDLPLPKTVADVGPGGGIVTSMRGINALHKAELENQYYGADKQSEIDYRNALSKGQNIHNQYLPQEYQLANQTSQQKLDWNPRIWGSEIDSRGAQGGLARAETSKINYLLAHPGLMGGEDAKTIQSLIDMGFINKNNLNKNPQPQINQSNNQQPNQIIPQQYQNGQQPQIGQQQSFQQPQQQNGQQTPGFSPTSPFQTGNPQVDAILNRKFADSEYKNKMNQGFNWVHLPVETKNQLVAQGYGMGIDPLKMMEYVNKGMGLQQIAEKEGLDPNNLPPPIYSPTTATKTRVQQVQQVGQELDYLSSATTSIIKQYADTFAGFSPERIKDMLSSDPSAQKRLGRYVGALSVQTGLANGRVLMEGGKAGVEVMRMVKDSSLKGIDQHTPVKMSKIGYEEAQKTIDEILQRGAKIRTTTGMNPMSEIGKSKSKQDKNSSLKDPSTMTTEEINKELAALRGKK